MNKRSGARAVSCALALVTSAAVITACNGSGDSAAPAGTVVTSQEAPAADTTSAPALPTYTPPSETPSPTPSGPKTFTFGEPVTLTSTDIDGTTTSVDLTVGQPQVATVEPGEFGSTPEHGNFVVFTMDVTGDTAGYDFNTYNFYVRGTDGTHYNEAITSGGFGADIPLTNLQPGEKLHGVVVYDVPVAHGTLVFTGSSDEAIGEWPF